MNYIYCHNKKINYYKKLLKKLILCLLIQILFYTCIIIYGKSIPEFVKIIIGIVEFIVIPYLFVILLSFIYRIINNSRKNKYSSLFVPFIYDNVLDLNRIIFAFIYFISWCVAIYVAFSYLEKVTKYTKVFLILSIAINILLLAYNLYQMYKIKQNIKYEEKLESELQIYQNDLSKYLKATFVHFQQIYVHKPLFIIETEYEAKEKIGIISELNLKLSPWDLCKNPNKASTIILLEKHTYERDKYCFTDYNTKFLGNSGDGVPKYFGGIKYQTIVKNEGISSDSLLLKQPEEIADEEYIFFILNFQFSKVKHLDFNSNEVRELKGYWPNGNLMFKGDYNFLAEFKYANWVEYYENGKLKYCYEDGVKKEYDINGNLKIKYSYIPDENCGNIG